MNVFKTFKWQVFLMKNTRMIMWVMLLTLAVGLLTGCDGIRDVVLFPQMKKTT